ncbi:MAG: hypothetical protein HYZ53_29605 [Planctomycetes bacterium]|nr:hypothetical protein [Planctomycetota bacterium]
MSQEEGSVELAEFVLRRVHRNHYDAGKPIPVTPAAFRPSDRDTQGLSVSRLKYVTAEQLAASGRQPHDYYVVQLAVEEISRLGLTVVQDPDPRAPPGHAFIPELTADHYRSDKQRMKDLTFRLAEVASRAIVHVPLPREGPRG